MKPNRALPPMKHVLRLDVLKAQNAIADVAKYPQFNGSVAVVDTRPM